MIRQTFQKRNCDFLIPPWKEGWKEGVSTPVVVVVVVVIQLTAALLPSSSSSLSKIFNLLQKKINEFYV